MLANLTGGISPVALSLAYTDWASHLATSPQRQIESSQEAMVDASRFSEACAPRRIGGAAAMVAHHAEAAGRRFGGTGMGSSAVQSAAQAFLLGEQWWHNATSGVRGVAPQNEAIVEFSIRQVLDCWRRRTLSRPIPRC